MISNGPTEQRVAQLKGGSLGLAGVATVHTLLCISLKSAMHTRIHASVCVCVRMRGRVLVCRNTSPSTADARTAIPLGLFRPRLPAARRCSLYLAAGVLLGALLGRRPGAPLRPPVGLLRGPAGESNSGGHSPSSKTRKSKACTSPLGGILAHFPCHPPSGQAASGSWKKGGTASSWSPQKAPAVPTL